VRTSTSSAKSSNRGGQASSSGRENNLVSPHAWLLHSNQLLPQDCCRDICKSARTKATEVHVQESGSKRNSRRRGGGLKLPYTESARADGRAHTGKASPPALYSAPCPLKPGCRQSTPA